MLNFITLNWMLGGIPAIRPTESRIPITDSCRSCNLIKFNGKIELGSTLSMGCCRRDITVCRMVMTLPIAPTLFSRWQCVVGDRLKGTRVFENDEKSARKLRNYPSGMCKKSLRSNQTFPIKILLVLSKIRRTSMPGLNE